jgi:hypothetical protein
MRSTRSRNDGARVPDPSILTPPAGQSGDLRAPPSLNVGQHLCRHTMTSERGGEGRPHLATGRNPAGHRRHAEPGSSITLRISTSVRSASRQWVMSACQRSLGWSAANRFHDDRGRFCGCETTNPRRDKIRQIVETVGTGEIPAASRWAAIVSAPASTPVPDRCGWQRSRRGQGRCPAGGLRPALTPAAGAAVGP